MEWGNRSSEGQSADGPKKLRKGATAHDGVGRDFRLRAREAKGGPEANSASGAERRDAGRARTRGDQPKLELKSVLEMMLDTHVLIQKRRLVRIVGSM